MLFVVIILRPILLSEWCAPVWRQNAVDTTLGKKMATMGIKSTLFCCQSGAVAGHRKNSRRWIVLKRTAIVGN